MFIIAAAHCAGLGADSQCQKVSKPQTFRESGAYRTYSGRERMSIDGPKIHIMWAQGRCRSSGRGPV